GAAAPGLRGGLPAPGAAVDPHPAAGADRRRARRPRLAHAVRERLPAPGGVLGLARAPRLPDLTRHPRARAPRVLAGARPRARHAGSHPDAGLGATLPL